MSIEQCNQMAYALRMKGMWLDQYNKLWDVRDMSLKHISQALRYATGERGAYKTIFSFELNRRFAVACATA